MIGKNVDRLAGAGPHRRFFKRLENLLPWQGEQGQGKRERSVQGVTAFHGIHNYPEKGCAGPAMTAFPPLLRLFSGVIPVPSFDNILAPCYTPSVDRPTAETDSILPERTFSVQ
jgi:hypothetical protein